MKIESIIQRKNGTRVTLDAPTRHYHFKPTDTDPRHLAEVTEASHIAMLLRIRDGYRAVDGEELPEDTTDTSKDAFTRELKGSSVHNATYTIKGGDTIELDDLVGMAFEDSGLSEDDWNDLADQERYEYIDRTLSELVDPPEEGATQETPPATAADAPTDDAKTPPTSATSASEGEGEGQGEEPEELSREEWAAKYKALYGRNPNKNLTVAQIKRAVVDA